MVSFLFFIVALSVTNSAFGYISHVSQRPVHKIVHSERKVSTKITSQNVPALNLFVKSENEVATVVSKKAFIVKIFITSALIFCASSFSSPLTASASTAPVAQAIAALEANGKTVEDLVPEEAPKITKKSSPRAISVGNRLKALNAKMYGAFWYEIQYLPSCMYL